MGRRLRPWLFVGLAVLCLPFVVWSAYSQSAFGTWNPFAQPTRIGYCGRDYGPGAHFNSAQIGEIGNGSGVFPFRQVGSTAGGLPIYAKPIPDSRRKATPYSGPEPCAMTVYLKTGRDDFIAYGLSGGP